MNELRYDTIFHKIDFLQEFQVITKILLQLGASSMYKNDPKPKILTKNGSLEEWYGYKNVQMVFMRS